MFNPLETQPILKSLRNVRLRINDVLSALLDTNKAIQGELGKTLGVAATKTKTFMMSKMFKNDPDQRSGEEPTDQDQHPSE